MVAQTGEMLVKRREPTRRRNVVVDEKNRVGQVVRERAHPRADRKMEYEEVVRRRHVLVIPELFGRARQLHNELFLFYAPQVETDISRMHLRDYTRYMPRD